MKPASMPFSCLIFLPETRAAHPQCNTGMALAGAGPPYSCAATLSNLRDHTAPVERILLVSCIPDYLGADEIQLWLHDADHLGYKGLKIFDHRHS